MGERWVRRRVRDDSQRDLFIAVAHPLLMRMLVLVVRPEAIPREPLPSTRALQTTVELADSGKTELRISLLQPEMARVFSPFVDDVVDAAASSSDDEGAVAALLDRFAHWQRLL